jgi:flagellar hook assembly protein FlgD
MGHETWFGFDLPNAARVSLAIYDLTGRRVATIASGEMSANRYRMRWDTRDERGATVPAGLYFAHFETQGLSRTARLIVLP